jgi:hypothetical protein
VRVVLPVVSIALPPVRGVLLCVSYCEGSTMAKFQDKSRRHGRHARAGWGDPTPHSV